MELLLYVFIFVLLCDHFLELDYLLDGCLLDVLCGAEFSEARAIATNPREYVRRLWNPITRAYTPWMHWPLGWCLQCGLLILSQSKVSFYSTLPLFLVFALVLTNSFQIYQYQRCSFCVSCHCLPLILEEHLFNMSGFHIYCFCVISLRRWELLRCFLFLDRCGFFAINILEVLVDPCCNLTNGY
jgi:hypothetical protein